MHVVFCPFFKSGEDSAKLFQFSGKALDQTSLLINIIVIFAGLLSIRFWRNNRNDTLMVQLFYQFVGVICLIHQCICGLYSFNQETGLSHICRLAACKDKIQWVPKSIDHYMDFCRKAAFRAPQCLVLRFGQAPLRAPAEQACARTIVPSIIMLSISGSLAK